MGPDPASPAPGLSQAQAQPRLHADGPERAVDLVRPDRRRPGPRGWVLLRVGSLLMAGLLAGVPEGQARAATFVALALSSVVLILVNCRLNGPAWRGLRQQMQARWRIVAGTLLGAARWAAPVRALFRLDAPAAAAGPAAAVWLSLHWALRHRPWHADGGPTPATTPATATPPTPPPIDRPESAPRP